MIFPYVLIILICSLIIILVNSMFLSVPFLTAFLFTILNVVMAIVIDILISVLLNFLPKRIYNYKARFFTVKKAELKFYKKIKLNKWKSYVPDLGAFKKGKLESTNLNYLKYFLQESCSGEIIHIVILFSVFIHLVFINHYFLTIVLPVMVVNFLLNIPPIFIQRYNRPKLIRVYELKEYEEKKLKKLNKS